MLSSQVVDHDLDRPEVQAERSVEPTGTNMACGLAYYFSSPRDDSRLVVGCTSLSLPTCLSFAGDHGGAVIPVPIPNTEVKGSIAEGSASPGRARVGRRQLFFVLSVGSAGSVPVALRFGYAPLSSPLPLLLPRILCW